MLYSKLAFLQVLLCFFLVTGLTLILDRGTQRLFILLAEGILQRTPKHPKLLCGTEGPLKASSTC